MDAKELRIGNIVDAKRKQYGEKHIIVESIAFNRINIDFREYSIDDIKPIELTEDWLLRLGIELIRSNKDSGYKEYGIKKNGFNIVLSIPCNEPPACYVNGVFVEIDYVHQFQNLCFVLTGEELMPQ